MSGQGEGGQEGIHRCQHSLICTGTHKLYHTCSRLLVCALPKRLCTYNFLTIPPLALLVCMRAWNGEAHRLCAVFLCTAYLSVVDLWGRCVSQHHMQGRVKQQVMLLALTTPSNHADCDRCPSQYCCARVLQHTNASFSSVVSSLHYSQPGNDMHCKTMQYGLSPQMHNAQHEFKHSRRGSSKSTSQHVSGTSCESWTDCHKIASTISEGVLLHCVSQQVPQPFIGRPCKAGFEAENATPPAKGHWYCSCP